MRIGRKEVVLETDNGQQPSEVDVELLVDGDWRTRIKRFQKWQRAGWPKTRNPDEVRIEQRDAE